MVDRYNNACTAEHFGEIGRTMAPESELSGRGIREINVGFTRLWSMSSSPPGSRRFINVTGFPFPLGPALERKTIRKELIPGLIWTFEQEQGLAGTTVSTNVRMTAVKTSRRSLWIHAPIAPTEECVQLLHELELPVEAIVNPTYAYEHRVFVPSFSRRFPSAKVYSVRGWSFPLPLPDSFLGIDVEAYLDERERLPWLDDFDCELLPVSFIGLAPYTEAAFFHRRTKTLITTDLFVRVSETPPEVIPEAKLEALGNPDSFLASLVSGSAMGSPKNIPSTVLGWMRMTTLALFLGPASLLDPTSAFGSISGRLTVSPVLRVLVFGKIRSSVEEWTEKIMKWPFDKIIPAHFDAPVRAGPDDVRNALTCLIRGRADGVHEADLKNLRVINRLLRSLGIVKEEEEYM